MLSKNSRYFVQEDLDRLDNLLTKSHVFSTEILKLNGLDLISVYKYSTESPLTGYVNHPPLEYEKLKTEPFMFSFSVAKKRKNNFFEILDGFINDGIKFGDSQSYNKLNTVDLRELVYDHVEIEHTVYNTEYIRFQYKFDNTLKALIVTTLIEDTIRIFENMWGYKEDGEEVSLMKYRIGDIVSLKMSPQNTDWIVISYIPERPYTMKSRSGMGYSVNTTGTKYGVLYKLVVIESNNNGIIKYGSIVTADESDIYPSRNNNLNTLLN